jgi:DNA-binding PadR family transcriptional regulator
MSGETMPVSSFALLGLLSQSPASGYELAQRIEGPIAYFWPMSKSNVYGELTRLESLALISGTEVSQVKLPNKRVFHLTEAGLEALDGWLQEASFIKERTKNSLLVKLLFADRLTPEQVAALIDEALLKAEGERAELGAKVDQLEAVPAAFWARATALYGRFHAEATVAWAEEMARVLKQRS